MIPLYNIKNVRKVDHYAINKLGIPSIVLMENASINIYNKIISFVTNHKTIKTIGIVCGNGNNGGDGFAVARHFTNNNYFVNVMSLGRTSNMSKDCLINYNILNEISKKNKNLRIYFYKSLKDLSILNSSDIIIDTILGSGAKGELNEPYPSIIKSLNKKKAIKISIDLPTGLDSDRATGNEIFRSDLTISIGAYKKGLFFNKGFINCCNIENVGIGISNKYFEELKTKTYLIEPEDIFKSLPKREKDVHKYSAGKVLTIAGSGKYPGAAVLASKAVFKTGAGASVLYFPRSIRNLVQKKLDEVVVHSYDDNKNEYLTEENLGDLLSYIKWTDVISIGPGLGRNNKTQSAVSAIIKRRGNKKIVIDADAIFALSNNVYRKINLKNSVLTPHMGEFAYLLGISLSELQNDILKYGKKFVKETCAFLVLKGAPSIIFTPNGEIFINSAGNSGMAKFGTGDVLTGLIAGFASQNISFENAILSAVYLHSLSADILSIEKTELSYTAIEILNNIPYTTKFLMSSCA
ncbi:MAG: hypothetical protein CO128_02315 [Ignavibacteriales bacterium CG_4_9_14_3_um_filter_30_11]|nr:MAG: hypothetical protein CO128_02315 [Ignavibacteriales bacterium CG_4_9_14_3_um_filter_30_11]